MQMLQRQSAQSEQVGKSGNAAENGGSSEAGGSQVKPSSQMEGQVPSSSNNSSRSVEEGPIEHQFGGGGGNSPIEKHGRQASSASPVKLIGGGGGGSGAAAKTAAAAAAADSNSAEQASQTVTQSTAVATTLTVTGSHHHHNSSNDGSVLLFSSSAATQSANGFSALAANDHLNHHLNTYTAPDTVMSEDSSKLQAESSPSQLAAAADKLESSVHNSSNNNNNSSNNINNGNNGHWMTTASAAAGINTAKMFASRWTPAPASDQSASSSPTTSSSFSGLFDDRQTGDCGGMTLRGGEEGEEEEEASTVLKTRGLFSRRLREWESRLAAAAASTTFTTSGAFTTTLPRAYVMRINRLSCSNPLVLRPFAVDNTAAVDADADDSDDLGLNGEGHSNPPPSSFKNDLNTTSTALEYLMTSDEEEEEEEDSLMSNDGGGNFGILNSTDDSTNANSGGSCCKYRLKRPRLQCIEEEIANLNLDQSDSSSSATLDLPVLQTAPAALISSRPFNESNFNKTTTTTATTTTTTMIGSFKEKKEDHELRSSKEFTTSTNDPFALLPKKSEDRDGEPRCQVETASIQSLISAIKQFLADGKKESDANITVEGGKSEVSKMCLPMLKIVSFEAAKSLPTNSTDELQELAQKLSMNSNGSSPDEMTGATTSTIGKMFEKGRKQESVRNQQKGCIIANGSKSVEATAKSRRVSFLDSDDDDDDHISKAHISNHVVPNILSSLGNADQINPFGSVGRGFKEVVSPFLTKGAERNSRLHVLASATEMQEKLELQRAIMEDIEERAAKMKCSAAASSAATATTNTCQENETNGSTKGSFLNPNPRTLSSFLRPSTSVLSNINHSRRTASQENGGNSGATQKKEHSSLTALLQSEPEEDEQPISKTAAENGNGKSGNSGNNGEDSGQTLSFLERAKLQAARQPCHSLPPVSSFVGTLGGKNFELEEEGNSSSSNSAGGSSFSFLRSNGSAKAGLSAFSSSFLSGLITEAMGVDGSTSGGGGGGGGGGDTGSTTEPAATATSPSKKGTAPVFGGATSFNPNSPLTTAPLPNSSNSSESALSAAELEARNSRITRFFSKLAAEGESRADALALAAASTLSLISSAGVGGGAEKVQDAQEVAAENGTKNGTKDASNDGGKSTAQVAAPGASSSSSSTAAVATSAAQPPPYKPFTNYVDATSASAAATAGAAAASSSSAAASSSASSSANQPEKRVSGKAPMKRPFHQPQRWSKMDNISIGSGSSSPPPPLYYEDDEATMEMVLKMSAQEASLTKVSKKGGGGGSGGGGSSKAHCPVKSSKIPKTDNGLQISAGQKEGKSRGDDDNAKNDNDNENGSGKEVEMLLDDNDNDDDEELWRSIPSTSGTQKVKPAANEPIPGYPKLMKQTQQQQQSLLYYNQGQRSVVNTAHFSSSSSSSSSPSAGSYHPRPLNLVGQKRKREVTFIEMIKEGGGGDGRSPPPLPRPSSSSTSNGGEGGEMGVLPKWSCRALSQLRRKTQQNTTQRIRALRPAHDKTTSDQRPSPALSSASVAPLPSPPLPTPTHPLAEMRLWPSALFEDHHRPAAAFCEPSLPRLDTA